MKVTIIGASGKTGMKLVRESLKRGHQVVAVASPSYKTGLKRQNLINLTTRMPVVG